VAPRRPRGRSRALNPARRRARSAGQTGPDTTRRCCRWGRVWSGQQRGAWCVWTVPSWQHLDHLIDALMGAIRASDKCVAQGPTMDHGWNAIDRARCDADSVDRACSAGLFIGVRRTRRMLATCGSPSSSKSNVPLRTDSKLNRRANPIRSIRYDKPDLLKQRTYASSVS
jgi:hypothetical protein